MLDMFGTISMCSTRYPSSKSSPADTILKNMPQLPDPESVMAQCTWMIKSHIMHRAHLQAKSITV